MTKFIINRNRWYRGHGVSGSRLVREEDGKCCCLGLIGLQVGIPEGDMCGVGSPSNMSIDSSKHKFPAWLQTNQDIDTLRAMRINDASDLDESTREKSLTALFAEHDIELEFVDE